jgi:hypothetical protein
VQHPPSTIAGLARLSTAFGVLLKLRSPTRIPLKALPKKIDTTLIKSKNAAGTAIQYSDSVRWRNGQYGCTFNTANIIAASALPRSPAIPRGLNSAASPSSTAPAAPAPLDNTTLIQELELAPTTLELFQKLFTQNSQLLSEEEFQNKIIFNFNEATPTPSVKNGAVKTANIGIFPILTKLDISTTLAFFNSCGINISYIHSRTTEFLIIIDEEIDFNMIFKNDFVIENLFEVIDDFNKF